jgi:hypothetical protein
VENEELKRMYLELQMENEELKIIGKSTIEKFVVPDRSVKDDDKIGEPTIEKFVVPDQSVKDDDKIDVLNEKSSQTIENYEAKFEGLLFENDQLEEQANSLTKQVYFIFIFRIWNLRRRTKNWKVC